MAPQLEAQGAALYVIGVGTPESGAEFAELCGFPADKLFVDPTRSVYKSLQLYGDLDGTEGWFFDPKVVEGVRRLFFTKVTGERLKERGTEGLKEATRRFKPLPPPEPRDAVQQGGTFVLRGSEVVMAHRDEATADHAKAEDVLGAAGCGC
mmetsp:Transcript_24732/g.84613  ORF Transcript_24732/g.84613 Transcript_24732/m.84613 type:complete len:151 (+) Transcript_24732:318-770(+)